MLNETNTEQLQEGYINNNHNLQNLTEGIKMEVSIKQMIKKTDKEGFHEHKQFLTDTLQKVKGNIKLEAKLTQTYSKTPLFQSIFESFVQKDFPKIPPKRRIKRLKTIDKDSDCLVVPINHKIIDDKTVSDCKSEELVLDNSQSTKILTAEKNIKPLESEQSDTSKITQIHYCDLKDLKKQTGLTTSNEPKSEDYKIPEVSQSVIESLGQSEFTASNKTVTAMAIIKHSNHKTNFEYCEPLNWDDEQFEMSQRAILLQRSKMTAYNETVTAIESIKPSNLDDDPLNHSEMTTSNTVDIASEIIETTNSDTDMLGCETFPTDELFEMIEDLEMFEGVDDDPLNHSEMTVNYTIVTESEIIELAIPDTEFDDDEILNCANELSDTQGVDDDQLMLVEETEPSMDNRSEFNESESCLIFNKSLNASKSEMLEELKNIVGDEGVSKLNRLFNSENKISNKKAADEKKKLPKKTADEKKKSSKKDQLCVQNKRSTVKRKCASRKINYNRYSYKDEIVEKEKKKEKQEENCNPYLGKQRKTTTKLTNCDKYYNSEIPNLSSDNQNHTQKVKLVVNVVEEGNLQFMVDHKLLTYLKQKKKNQ